MDPTLAQIINKLWELESALVIAYNRVMELETQLKEKEQIHE